MRIAVKTQDCVSSREDSGSTPSSDCVPEIRMSNIDDMNVEMMMLPVDSNDRSSPDLRLSLLKSSMRMKVLKTERQTRQAPIHLGHLAYIQFHNR